MPLYLLVVTGGTTHAELTLQIQWQKIKEGVKDGCAFELLEGSFRYAFCFEVHNRGDPSNIVSITYALIVHWESLQGSQNLLFLQISADLCGK